MARRPPTLTKMGLSEAIHLEIGLSRADSRALVQRVVDALAETLDKGEQVKIMGFGTLSVHQKSERVGRNPKTGQATTIAPRRVVSFKPSASLKRRVADLKVR